MPSPSVKDLRMSKTERFPATGKGICPKYFFGWCRIVYGLANTIAPTRLAYVASAFGRQAPI
jgi:hypothetical protein